MQEQIYTRERDSGAMQDSDKHAAQHLALVVHALERDKRILADKNKILLASIDRSGYNYCDACGLVYEKSMRCDCIGGIDYD